jgi:hypothetical protein
MRKMAMFLLNMKPIVTKEREKKAVPFSSKQKEHGGQVLNYKFPAERYDYTQREVADHLAIYLTSVCRIIREAKRC